MATHQLPVSAFTAALKYLGVSFAKFIIKSNKCASVSCDDALQEDDVDDDEVECILANLIFEVP